MLSRKTVLVVENLPKWTHQSTPENRRVIPYIDKTEQHVEISVLCQTQNVVHLQVVVHMLDSCCGTDGLHTKLLRIPKKLLSAAKHLLSKNWLPTKTYCNVCWFLVVLSWLLLCKKACQAIFFCLTALWNWTQRGWKVQVKEGISKTWGVPQGLSFKTLWLSLLKWG